MAKPATVDSFTTTRLADDLATAVHTPSQGTYGARRVHANSPVATVLQWDTAAPKTR